MEFVMHAPAVSKQMTAGRLQFSVGEEVWPLHKPFRISRGTRTEARVIMVTITDGKHTGRGEAVPSKRYNETIASASAQLKPLFANGEQLDRTNLQKLLPPGAARNALDCALWDFDAKRSGQRVWELANIPVVNETETAFTISLDTPEKMAADAKVNSGAPILKLKLGGDNLDLARVQMVRKKAPDARMLIDANESWSPSHYSQIVSELARLGVDLIEQPFPAGQDESLESLDHPIPVCADESCHTTADLPRLTKRYEAINVKLDKTGGLTEALRLTDRARQLGFKILFGCMVCTSLGIAPARLLVRAGDHVDLDGPLLVARDRPNGLHYENGRIGLPSPELWG
ncbi:MAG TPA: N-acetyl-D-Glu racemase DgcA [Chthoniobacterales bacterium]|jgi:L-alanine-DL-glutamate epimerase-like enolase superfamily enzyme